MNKRRPPLPPSPTPTPKTLQHPSSSREAPSSGKPPLATGPSSLPPSAKPNPSVETTLKETLRRLELEKGSSEPHPRRRLASFSGLSSTGSLSPYTSWNSLNQSPSQASPEHPSHGALSSGSALRTSPLSSGQATPARSVSPTHLQVVREQMVVALQRLRELEEQVKLIPILQVNIAVLQEEKRQLAAQAKGQTSRNICEQDTQGMLRQRAHSVGCAGHMERRPKAGTSVHGKECVEVHALSGLQEFKMLSADMQLLEKKIRDARQETQGTFVSKVRGRKSVAVGDDLSVDDVVVILRSSLKPEETMLQAEVGPGMEFSGSSMTHIDRHSVAVQTCVHTRSLGVGNHTVASQTTAIGVSCSPDSKSVATGPNIPLEEWEVRRRVELQDKCVGRECVSTHCQAVNVVNVCDFGMVTMETMESLDRRKVQCRTIGCGDGTLKQFVSQGTLTEPVIMVTQPTLSNCPKTAHAHTQTVPDPPARTRSVAVWMASNGEQARSKMSFSKATTRDAGVGLANIHENFLVGLKKRNMACGPSRLPDPVKTRSIGVAVGDGRIREGDTQVEPGLDHCIQRMQRLLQEQQSLLTDKQDDTTSPLMHQPHNKPDTVSAIGSPTKANTVSKAKRKRFREKQISSVLHGERSTHGSDMRRTDGGQKYSDSWKDHRFEGLYLRSENVSCSEDSSSERSEGEEMKSRRECDKGENEVKEVTALSGQLGVPSSHRESDEGKRQRYQMNERTSTACHVLKAHLNNSKTLPGRELRSSLNTLQQEWFCVSSQKSACPAMVEDLLSALQSISLAVLSHMINMADGNGNTALHYSVSHSNFTVVQTLLHTGVCNVDQPNKAGYTPIMLAALAAVETQEDMRVVEDLFCRGDVNAKASQAGQTALMLAVSHGRTDMVKALLNAGSKVNLQDDEGSTSLMCASEHGHVEIVKLLLAQPGCDATLRDHDESTALSVALEAGHRDIAVLLYAHVNYSKLLPAGPS